MTDYENYCAELETAALDMNEVSGCEVVRAKKKDVARVRYTGNAPESEVYRVLNFSDTPRRPKGVELMVYRVRSL